MDRNKIDTIKKLEKKRKKYGLSAVEEKLYCKLNSELSGLPEKFFTKKFNDELDDVLAKSDALIKKLKKDLKK